MNKILILAAAITASSSAAFAGGTAAPETEAAVAASVAPAEAHDWSGFYAGASVGQNNGADDWAGEYFLGGSPVGSSSGSFDAEGSTAGLQAGANMQFDNIVVGIEGDLSWGDISGEGAAIDPLNPNPTVPSVSFDRMGSVRGRVGVAMGQVLLYGTAGWAAASGSMGLTNLDGAGDDRTADISANGWTAGVGAEVALSEHLSLKGEYLNTSLTMDENRFGDVLPADDLAVNGTFDVQTFKIGLNYSF